MNFDKTTEAYLMLRDAVAKIEADTKEKVAPLVEKMKELEVLMKDALQAQGTKSAKTAHGTCYLSQVATAKVTDFNDTIQYILENERFDLLERRVNKTVLQEIGDVPGVELTRVIKLNVRRS